METIHEVLTNLDPEVTHLPCIPASLLRTNCTSAPTSKRVGNMVSLWAKEGENITPKPGGKLDTPAMPFTQFYSEN